MGQCKVEREREKNRTEREKKSGPFSWEEPAVLLSRHDILAGWGGRREGSLGAAGQAFAVDIV